MICLAPSILNNASCNKFKCGILYVSSPLNNRAKDWIGTWSSAVFIKIVPQNGSIQHWIVQPLLKNSGLIKHVIVTIKDANIVVNYVANRIWFSDKL